VAWDDASAGLAVTLACLPGVDGTVELVDPVDELGVRDEPGARLLCGFELPGLTGEKGLFPGEVVGLRLSELAPCVGDVVEDGGAGFQVLTAASAGEESLARILGEAKVLVVDPPGALKVLVADPDGELVPTPGAGPEVGEVLLESGLLCA
jgi:hypothetical protein